MLAKMSPERREMDKISRSLSEVGYVALVKRLLGFKLKDPEAGLENQPLLGQPSAFIHAKNQRREMEQKPSDSIAVSSVILPGVVLVVLVDVSTVRDNELPTR